MALKRQLKGGASKGWKIEDVATGLEHFYKLNKRYPTAQEIDKFEFLPSSRSIQRKFGGIVNVRKQLNLSGQHNFTEGSHSSKRSFKINKRAHYTEKEIYRYLVNRFGTHFVHREYFPLDDRRSRVDFFVYHKQGAFLVDVFYPDSRPNLIGCLNSKMNKYKEAQNEYPVIFLQMNKEINSFELEDIVKNKKNKLKRNQYLMDIESFKSFCVSKDALEVVK